MKDTEKSIDAQKWQARQLRYKKAIVQELSLEIMEYQISDMQDACYSVQWASQSDLIDDLLGEDEAQEFKMMFSGLENDIERFQEDLMEEWVPECYEDFMVCIAGKSQGATVLGFDNYEEDYFGLANDFETSLAMDEAQKRLERLTKKQLISAGQQCFNIAFQYVGLRDRYNQLKASIDVLRGDAKGLFDSIKAVNEAWEKACSGDAWRDYKRWGFSEEMRQFDRVLEQFDPNSEIWLQ